MKSCEVCENDYDKTFEVVMHGKSHVFDSFECAIQALAPLCAHCGCRIIGHGNESEGAYYCSAHCARKSGHAEASDRT
jgi:Rieske Fe-S protein